MKTICLYFQVHQPFRLKNYRFFNIGHDHFYYDNYNNETIIRRISDKCYLPANQLLLDLIKAHGDRFRVSFSISGTALDQFELYAPDVLESFKKLAKTGCVEFLSETYSHSLASQRSKDEFIKQVATHREKIKKYFGQEPQVFRNTELIYSDDIGEIVAEMGYKAMITEGAKHILGWKSPNFLYYNALNPKLKILLKNYKLSDDISFRFPDKSWPEWPLTTEKFVRWLNEIDKKEEVVNLFMNYDTFGERVDAASGIFNFLKALPAAVFSYSNYIFATPSEVADTHQPVAAYNVPYPISWADEERDLTAWLGNELQDEAFDKLYKLENLVKNINDEEINRDWLYLQTSDHFYYMCTKFFTDDDLHVLYNPYDSPYQAFINYMNVLSDFSTRVYEKAGNLEIKPLTEKEIKAAIAKYEKEINALKSKLVVKPIAKTKPEPKVIEKVKKSSIPIAKIKEDKKAISATKKELKAIDKTVTEKKALKAAKAEDKNADKTKKSKSLTTSKKEKKEPAGTKKIKKPSLRTKKG
ncbi:MAG: polysaccharide deacetylase family protein [Bacteroidales bacterium]